MACLCPSPACSGARREQDGLWRVSGALALVLPRSCPCSCGDGGHIGRGKPGYVTRQGGKGVCQRSSGRVLVEALLVEASARRCLLEHTPPSLTSSTIDHNPSRSRGQYSGGDAGAPHLRSPDTLLGYYGPSTALRVARQAVKPPSPGYELRPGGLDRDLTRLVHSCERDAGPRTGLACGLRSGDLCHLRRWPDFPSSRFRRLLSSIPLPAGDPARRGHSLASPARPTRDSCWSVCACGYGMRAKRTRLAFFFWGGGGKGSRRLAREGERGEGAILQHGLPTSASLASFFYPSETTKGSEQPPQCLSGMRGAGPGSQLWCVRQAVNEPCGVRHGHGRDEPERLGRACGEERSRLASRPRRPTTAQWAGRQPVLTMAAAFSIF